MGLTLNRNTVAALVAILLAFAAPLGIGGARAWAESASEPAGVVASINSALIDAMRRGPALGFDGRFALLDPILTRAFNYDIMARAAISSREWNKLNDSQHAEIVDAFRRFSIANFAGRFDDFSGERFEILGERPALRGSVLVENRLITGKGETVPINYLVHKFRGGWKVIDIFLDAKFSELAVRRSEFISILNRSGFDALLAKIEEKIETIERGAQA